VQSEQRLTYGVAVCAQGHATMVGRGVSRAFSWIQVPEPLGSGLPQPSLCSRLAMSCRWTGQMTGHFSPALLPTRLLYGSLAGGVVPLSAVGLPEAPVSGVSTHTLW
jgi:hypothetical protein